MSRDGREGNKHAHELTDRLRDLEARIEALEATVLAGPAFLRGHRETARFLRVSESTVERWKRLFGLPLVRRGRHTYTTGPLLSLWLLKMAKQPSQWRQHLLRGRSRRPHAGDF